jgi:hypothetical protein
MVLNRAARPSRGWASPVSSTTSGWQRSSAPSIAAPATAGARRSPASMAGWETIPHGYGLKVFSSSRQRSVSPSSSSRAKAPDRAATKAPSGSAPSGPGTPAAASRAASTPLAAALPACIALVMVPKPSRIPSGWCSACPSRAGQRPAGSPRRTAAVAAAPAGPQVPVMCQPRS